MRSRILTLAGLGLLLLVAVPVLAAVAPGDDAPDFTLTDTAGKEHHLQDYLDDGEIIVLEWFNPDCPFIKKHHDTARTMDETFAAVKDSGVVWLAINSGGAGKQGAGLERNQKAVKDYEMTFPVLMDPDGKVGKAYGAKTTPNMYVISKKGKVTYTGAIDDNASVRDMGKTNYVAEALADMLAGKPVETNETKPYGCSVKYGK